MPFYFELCFNRLFGFSAFLLIHRIVNLFVGGLYSYISFYKDLAFIISKKSMKTGSGCKELIE